MKQIACTVTGRRTDLPTLRHDTTSQVYTAIMDTATRAVFHLPDDTPPHGATIRYGQQAMRYVIPEDPGCYEGPLLAYPEALAPLTVRETRFWEDGHPWIWKGCSDFLLYQRFLEGEDLGPLLAERVALGANLLRVFGMCHYISPFYPQRYPGYVTHLAPFARLLAAMGLRCEWVVFADAQIILPDLQAQRAHLSRIAEALRDESNVCLELVNEYPKNGVDPLRFTKPTGLLCARGSALADMVPPRPHWDYATWHGRRDHKVWGSHEDMYFLRLGIDGDGRPTDFGPVAIVGDEPIGFGSDQPGRRSADPELARRLALSARAHGEGATFHSDDGVRSVPMDEATRRCAEAFFAALEA